MRTLIPPPFLADTCKSWLHAFLGAAAGLPALAAAVLAVAAAPAGWPGPVRAALCLVVWSGLCVAAGRLRVARSVSVRLANSLLDTALPAPGHSVTGADAQPHRLRTGAWLVLHGLLGGASITVSGLLLMVAAALPTAWLRGGDRITVFLPVDVAGGAPGLWTLPAAALLPALAVCAAKGAGSLFRRLAPPLLGPLPAERLAALEGQVRVLAQRNRLARELHDSIGHSLTASTIQAAVAKELVETDPAAARRALTGLEEVSRAALDDLDHVLGLLREGRTPTSPPFSLTDLHALVDRVRRTGTDVSSDVTGDMAGVPATVSREAYRIVQEGLTNALRHGGPSEPVGLRVAATAAWLEVEVTNRINPINWINRIADPVLATARHPLAGRAHRRGNGQGVTGISERVHLLRGEVSAGPDASGTCWLLAVRIPLRSAP
ncbi:sensor histidine kinase [Streptomyces klenkii]|uniref:sensor histidine kinase n=1 Tax=Streptomyces klenkii TaxID=1420899 RepID=UPI001F544547|nr:histidine kinase [Streptomyces klenkii]